MKRVKSAVAKFYILTLFYFVVGSNIATVSISAQEMRLRIS